MAETTTTTRLPRPCKSARPAATARSFAGVSRQAPPYFCTMIGCSLIGASVQSPARLADRTVTAYPCADNFKVLVEGDKVRAIAGRDLSYFRLKAKKCRRGPRSHDERIGQRDAEQGGRVAHGLDHGEVSPRQRAIGAGQAIFVQRDLPSLQQEVRLARAY